jgi:uncharacterized protein (TIGR00369 family)
MHIRRFAASDQRTPVRLSVSPFASGLETTLVGVDAAARSLKLLFNPGAEYVAARQTLQGGAVATMLDVSMAFLAIALLPDDKSAATASLNISYLKPSFPGAYVAEAEVERLGRSMIFARARLTLQGGDTVATATGVFSVFDRPPDKQP